MSRFRGSTRYGTEHAVTRVMITRQIIPSGVSRVVDRFRGDRVAGGLRYASRVDLLCNVNMHWELDATLLRNEIQLAGWKRILLRENSFLGGARWILLLGIGSSFPIRCTHFSFTRVQEIYEK